MPRLWFQPAYTVKRLPGSCVVLSSDERLGILQGRSYDSVAPLLDGRFNADEIVERAGLSLAEGYFVLQRLIDQDHVVEVDAGAAAMGWPDVVLVADYLDAEGTGLVARPTAKLLVGPTLGACDCLQRRVRGQRPAAALAGEIILRPRACWDALSLTRLEPEIETWRRDPERLQHRLIEIDGDGTRTEHVIPPCPGCARPRVALQFVVSPYVGMVGAVRTAPIDDVGWRAAASVCVDGPVASVDELLRLSRRGAWGVGTTETEAYAGALGEALEIYCATFKGDEPQRIGRFVDIEDAVDAEDCRLVSATQYAEREAWNARWPAARHFVPEPFDPHAEIAWTPLQSLSSGRTRWLPTDLCDLGRGVADANGCAVGVTMEAAIQHAFLELVERDAVALWWYNDLQRKGVDLAAFGQQPVIDAFEARGLQLWGLDLTSDFGIPVVAAVCASGGKARGIGFGAHFDAAIAARRAVRETLDIIADDTLPAVDTAWDLDVADAPLLIPRGVATFGPSGSRDVAAAAARLGLDVLMLDLTRADVALSAVRLVIPGLRSFSARFAPGRLYDVPVKMGWRSAPLEEAGLRPPLMC